MDLSRIKYLRIELESECIDLMELSEIELAFMLIPEEELPEPIENAMASDQLNELESRIGVVERRVYGWVSENFGENEAINPSWDIGALAREIEHIPISIGALETTIGELVKGKL